MCDKLALVRSASSGGHWWSQFEGLVILFPALIRFTYSKRRIKFNLHVDMWIHLKKNSDRNSCININEPMVLVGFKFINYMSKQLNLVLTSWYLMISDCKNWNTINHCRDGVKHFKMLLVPLMEGIREDNKFKLKIGSWFMNFYLMANSGRNYHLWLTLYRDRPWVLAQTQEITKINSHTGKTPRNLAKWTW